MTGTVTRALLLLVVLLLLLLLLPRAARGQVVSGRTLEAGSVSAVAGAEVALVDERGEVHSTSVSDSAGFFVVAGRRPARFTLRVAHLGYDTVRASVMELAYGESVEVEVRLGPQPIALEPLTVVARARDESIAARQRREYYERVERYAHMRASYRILPRAELARLGLDAWKLTDAVSAWGTARAMRGGCAWYWNGRHLRGELFPGDMPVSYVEGIEMYDWSAPGSIDFLEPGAPCHVVVWTRDDVGRPPTLKRLLAALGIAAILLFLLD
jgi:hypothetical protein